MRNNTVRSSNRFSTASLLVLAFAVFSTNSFLFIAFFNPEIQGYGDAVRGWRDFNQLMFGGEKVWGPHNQIELRVYMIITTIAIIMLLLLSGLVKISVAITYLALPVAAYLATKLKPEFLLFPLALITLDLSFKKQILVILLILFMTVALKENNGVILLIFRLGYLAFTLWKPSLTKLVIFAVCILALDSNIEIIQDLYSPIAAYNYTRDIVNPEYSVLETILVFLASSYVSVNPNVDYIISLPAGFLILMLIIGKKIFKNSSWRKWLLSRGFQSGILTILLFTSVTHAFQNARYYFFFVHMFTSVGGGKTNYILLTCSVPLTICLTVYYKFFLGM